ncbi:MAG: hypothetical protein IT424_07395 [Pirellulales bacterium]|nr:hypothetical protein [Pirellulales bacterium]
MNSFRLQRALKSSALQSVLWLLVAAGMAPAAEATWRNPLVKQGYLGSPLVETSPFVLGGRLYLMETYQAFVDSPSKAIGADANKDVIRIRDVESKRIVAEVLPRHTFASAFVWDDRVYVFAARCIDGKPWRTATEVSMTSSGDLKHWTQPQVVWRCEPGEQVFNVAVCRGRDRFVLLYETNDPAYQPFTFKYCESDDLTRWRRIPDALYGADKYVGGPALYYFGDWYYTLYLESLPEGCYETRLTRSRDLKQWNDAPQGRPLVTFDRSKRKLPLRPAELSEKNASDAELCYFGGKTIVYFTGGDQQVAGDLQWATFDGTPQQLLESFFQGP